MFKRKKLIITGSVAVLGTFLIVFIRQQYVLPIVMYHSVLPEVPKANVITVSVKTFEKQMGFLKSHHYTVIPLGSVLDLVTRQKKLPAKAIVITFDDGNKDNFTYAFAILKKYNFPATVFVIVSEIGKPGRLSWDEMRQMQDSGLITFGSHTVHHRFLTALSSAEALKQEVRGSKQLLEEGLGKRVDEFSYPMGRFNRTVEQAVRDAGYRVAVVTNPGRKFSNTDVLALKRLRISENAGNLFVFWFETSGYYNFVRETRQRHK